MQIRRLSREGPQRNFGIWKRLWLIFFVPMPLLAAVGGGRVEKTYDTTSNPRVSLSNLNGQVVIKGWKRDQVHAIWVTASPRVEVDVEVLPTQGHAQKVYFNTHRLDPLATGGEEKTDYSIEVPVGSSLEIHNLQGKVHVEKIRGETWVDSVGGNISIREVAGHLAVRSVGGNIEVVQPSGRVEASSITGSLHFISPTGPVVRGNTTSGDIVYEGDFVSGGDYVLSDYSGNIEVRCPNSASFELNAKTVRGKVKNFLAITHKRSAYSSWAAGDSLLGTHNTGDATVQLTTFSGSINIQGEP